MKRTVYGGIALISISLILGCQSPKKEYKSLSDQISYKYIQLGEGIEPRFGEFISADLTVCKLNGDTLHYVPSYPYLFKLKQGPIDSALTRFSLGDSVVFKISRKLFNQRFNFYRVLQSDEGEVKFHLRIKESFNQEEAKEYQQKMLSYREVEEQAALKRYLNRLGELTDTLKDVYRLITKINHDGDSIKNGSTVTIDYQGSFLNGYVFEDTKTKPITPSFVYGREDQMIEGLNLGLSKLKSGERVKIILPSRRAFGKEGSLAGIVPPYTAVIFDVNIIKVEN